MDGGPSIEAGGHISETGAPRPEASHVPQNPGQACQDPTRGQKPTAAEAPTPDFLRDPFGGFMDLKKWT